jgi:AcrR family transcriptional regulator
MGRPPLIDREVAVKTALEIIDNEGLDAISTRVLAKRLGVASSSLYHHFQNKEMLLQAVCALIFLEIPLPDEAIDRWTDLIAETAFNTRQAILEHPNALPLMARFPPRQVVPHIYERFGNLLLERGAPVDMITAVLNAFDTLVIGSATVKLARGQSDDEGPDTKQPGSLADWERANTRSEEDVFRLMCRALGDGLGSPRAWRRAKQGRRTRGRP